MRYKRLLSLTIIFAAISSVISCGSSGTTDISRSSDSSDVTSAESTSPEIAPEYIKPNADYNGETVTVASYKYTGAWQILNYNIFLNEENGDVINDAIVERNRHVEDELNVNFELYPLESDDRGSSSKLQKLILAGDDTIDFALSMSASIAPMLTTTGMLIDLNSVPTLDLSHSWWNQAANDEYTIYGHQLAAVGDISFFNYGAPIVTYFSKELVEANKFDNPYELVYDGKWTLDKMISMATEAARDLNGDQQVDLNDQFGIALEGDSLQYLLVGCGVRLSQHTSDGDISITADNEKTINICQKLIPFMYQSNVTFFAGRGLATGSSPFSEIFMPKLMNNELLFFSNNLLVSLNLRAMESDFGILPMPKYDETQENYVSFANTWFSDHLVIPATNQNLELTGNVIEAMGYYSKQLIKPAFIDTTVLNKSTRDEDSAKMVRLILDTQTFDVVYIFDWGKVRSNFASMAYNNNPNFASSYASIKDKILASLQTTIDELKK